MTDEVKLYQAYYQLDRLWTGNKAITQLHKVMSISKKDIKSWLAKQALWTLMDSISLIYFLCLIMFLKETRTNIS